MRSPNEPSDFSPREREMAKLLSEYRVSAPSADVVDDLIARMQPLMPAKPRRGYVRYRAHLLRGALLGVRFMSPSFWLLSLLLYAAGYAVAVQTPQNPVQVVLFLAPLPLLLSMRELFRGREEGVYELELACRIAPQELTVARVLAALVYNTALNAGLSLALVSTQPSALLWKITLLWLTPMLLTGAVTLFLCGHIRGPLAVPSCLCCWVAAALFLSSQSGLLSRLLRQELWQLALPVAIGAALYIMTVVRLHSRYAYEGSLRPWN